MDYIRESIEWLKKYNRLKSSIETMALELKDLNVELDQMGYKPIDYSGMPHGNYKIPDDEICNRIVKRDKKDKAIQETKEKIEKLDLILSKLDLEEREILKAKFIDGLSYEEMSKQLNLSFATITRKKNEGLRNLALQLWGIVPMM